MARSQQRARQPKRQPQLEQPYDSALKSLLGEEVAEILPNLLPDAEYISEENIELDRTTLKVDLVYNITYKGRPNILNMELQTGPDSDMMIRMVKYHIGLYDKHRLPVMSMILYPFETSLPEVPFELKSGDELRMWAECRVVALWKLEARTYIEQQIVVMYTFLPAMQGATAPLLVQAIEAMKQRYTKPRLGEHLARFRLLLERSTTVSEQDKQRVMAHMQTYDSLIDQSEYFQRKTAEAEAKGKAEAEAAEVQALQRMALEAVEDQYPALVELAQERVLLMRQPELLRQLVKHIFKAPDEATARWLLTTLATA